jgi:hypothetical protein
METPKNFGLVIVGKYGWKMRKFKVLINKLTKNNVTWLSNVCDGKLYEIYQNCSAYISVSLDEGFDIPTREVQVFEKRCILSNLPIRDEMNFAAKVTLVDATNTYDISKAISSIS